MGKMPAPSPQGICRLCLAKADLVESHIIPRFVFKWLTDTGTGYLRSPGNPNRREQDTRNLKLPFLCGPCDNGRFGPLETWFANTFFHPLARGDEKTFEYDRRLRAFALSVLWRVLAFYLEQDRVEDKLIDRALLVAETWRRHLLEGEGLGPFDRIHLFSTNLLATDTVAQATFEMPVNVNRYFTRAVDAIVEPIEDDAVVVAKFGRFVAVGELTPPMLDEFEGTLVESSGTFEAERNLDIGRVGWLLMNRARAATEHYQKGLSPRQTDKLRSRFEQDPELLVRGDYGRAASADFELLSRPPLAQPRPGRNDPCPCGSGVKFKRCHGVP